MLLVVGRVAPAPGKSKTQEIEDKSDADSLRFNLNPAVEIIRASQALELASEIAVFINCGAVGRSSFASRAYASTAGFRFNGLIWSPPATAFGVATLFLCLQVRPIP
jgi:hypothetical protein